MLSTRPSLDAAADSKLPLKALILTHISLEKLVAQIVLSTTHCHGNELAGAPTERPRTLGTRGIDHWGLELVRSVICLAHTGRVLHGVTGNDTTHDQKNCAKSEKGRFAIKIRKKTGRLVLEDTLYN